MPEKGSGKWQALLQDRDVRRWHDNVARGARATADNYLRLLGRFCEASTTTPKALLDLKVKERDDTLSDFVSQLIDGKKTSMALGVKKAVVSWLDWNGQKLSRNIRIPHANERPTLREEYVPEQDVLRRVLNVANAQARASISVVAFAGQRLEVLGNYEGTDGLRFRDFPEARIEKKALVFEVIPTLIRVPASLSKNGLPYLTFLGAEGCEYISGYARERMEDGEKLTLESPVLTPKIAEKEFIRSNNVGDLIRKPMRAAGVDLRPYVWRSYFASRAMMAESKGLLRDWRAFFMGHDGGIQHRYSLQKRLPSDTIEAMRKAYAAALPYLETTQQRQAEDPTLRVVNVLLQAAGYSEEEIREMALETKSQEEIAELLRDKPPSGPAASLPMLRQRIIPLGGLDAALAEGWAFKASLPDGRAVVEGARHT